MARKKIEPITGLGSEDKLTVQKSQPLFALWRSDLTLPEFKILDTYLARIDSHKPDRRAVIFDRGELEGILGVKKINLPDLKDRLKHLMGTVVEIPDSSVKKGVRLVTLFEECVAEQDESGFWQVKMECTQKAMRYFFNVEQLGYLRYKLRCISSLSSRYTYIMFLYLEANRYRRSWEVELPDLKKILNCDQEEVYKEFKRFNDRLLKRVHKEMHEKTECRYTYDLIKKGRSVVAVRFTVETLPRLEADENQITLEQWELWQDNQGSQLWQEPLQAFGFSKAQIDELFSLLCTVPETEMPHSPISSDIDLSRYHYIDQLVKKMLRIDSQKPIKSKFSYLKKLIEQDIGA